MDPLDVAISEKKSTDKSSMAMPDVSPSLLSDQNDEDALKLEWNADIDWSGKDQDSDEQNTKVTAAAPEESAVMPFAGEEQLPQDEPTTTETTPNGVNTVAANNPKPIAVEGTIPRNHQAQHRINNTKYFFLLIFLFCMASIFRSSKGRVVKTFNQEGTPCPTAALPNRVFERVSLTPTSARLDTFKQEGTPCPTAALPDRVFERLSPPPTSARKKQDYIWQHSTTAPILVKPPTTIEKHLPTTPKPCATDCEVKSNTVTLTKQTESLQTAEAKAKEALKECLKELLPLKLRYRPYA